MPNETFYIGQSSGCKKAFTAEETLYYCRHLSGDNNPLHYDAEYAAKTRFKKCIVPGIMVSSLFGGILGSVLPGNGTIQLGQTCRFINPVFIDEEVEAVITITNIRQDKPVITFLTRVIKRDGTIAIEGEAVVLVATN